MILMVSVPSIYFRFFQVERLSYFGLSFVGFCKAYNMQIFFLCLRRPLDQVAGRRLIAILSCSYFLDISQGLPMEMHVNALIILWW